jgi:uncharacterized protein (UPF0218 family)
MSITFERPVSEDTKNRLQELFKGIVAHDERQFLINDIGRLHQSDMADIARKEKQIVTADLVAVGDVKTLSDGTQYKATLKGWIKITAEQK